MKLVEKRPWSSVTLFCLILVVTAVALEFGFESIDPWRLPAPPQLQFAVNEFPSLAGFDFTCAQQGLVTKIDLARKIASCGAVLTPEMARCESSAPLRGFADKIRCGKFEKAACETGGVQALGLFKGDVACANSTSETDLGPPAARVRTEDL